METKTTTPTERELEILKILWALGQASVRDVFDVMHAEDIAQNTVQTFLRMMEDKGLVAPYARGAKFILPAPLFPAKDCFPVSATRVRRGRRSIGLERPVRKETFEK